MNIERCCICDEPTERAGRSDDSIYCDLLVEMEGFGRVGDEIGPLCLDCYHELLDDGKIGE